MNEEIIIDKNAGLAKRYESLLTQIDALVSGEPNMVANFANITAALKTGMGFFWVGFYHVEGEDLVLGPFQGPVACTRIRRGKGVCGTAWDKKHTIIVEDVDQYPGHIACSSYSKSEIVVPILKDGEVTLVLDVDSDQLNNFNKIDKLYLEKLSKTIESFL